MNKKIALCVAMGCTAAFAATNYDLLGRNGSKKNSPMVYRNVDYGAMKKDRQQDAASLRGDRSLKKLSSGLNGLVALEGAFSTRGLAFSKNGNPYSFYLKRYYQNGYEGYGYYELLNGSSNTYLNELNNVFKPVNIVQNYTPNGLIVNNSSPNNGPASNVYGFDFTEQYYYNFNNSTPFSALEYNVAKKGDVEWWLYNSGYSQCQECGDVGLYMDADAFPVRLNPSKVVKYLVYDENDHIFPSKATEMLSARTYSILQASTTENTRVFVTNALPQNPGSKTPQVYMGVHNRANSPEVLQEDAVYYGPEARDLDNYIYNNRTVEVVAAGNYWIRNNDAQLNAQAHAANAITVGAVNAGDQKIADYTSNNSKYCTRGIGNCPNGYYTNNGSSKPEIYGYTNFYMDNDRKRTYTNWFTQEAFVYDPYYSGTESAASYTAGMVAGLLRANPFYRWHPEVVKAVLLASGDNNINTPYPHGQTPATTKVPTYRSTVFNRFHNDYFHESRYWIGDWDNLYTHSEGNSTEIRFSVKRPDNKYNFSAAIAWLTSGNDIANYGKIPQDFDLYVYESNSSNVDNIDVYNYKTSSRSGGNAFEKVSFSSSAQYLTFRILLYTEDSRSENYRQAVIGFDVASAN